MSDDVAIEEIRQSVAKFLEELKTKGPIYSEVKTVVLEDGTIEFWVEC